MKTTRLIIGVLVGAWSAGALWGDTLLLVDGQSSQGTLVGLETAGEVTWRTGDGRVLKVEAEEVERIEQTTVQNPASGSQGWLVSAGGMRIPGQCGAPTKGKTSWEHPVLGKMTFAFEDVRLYLGPKEGRTAAQAAEELEGMLAKVGATDVVYLANGDAVGGVMESLGTDGAVFNCKMGRLSLATDKLVGITFSNALKPYTAASVTYARVQLADGTVLVGTVSGTGEKLLVYWMPGEKFEVARNTVASIEFANTKLVSLSELEPTFVKETPYFDRVWHWQRDRSVWGRPLTIGNWSYRKGIGMHARCQLDYDLDGKYRLFRSDVGIDGEVEGAGDCVVVVYGDGKPLTQAVEVTGRVGPRQVNVDVSNVKRLTLMADFGGGTDAGDHVTWGNARLVKK